MASEKSKLNFAANLLMRIINGKEQILSSKIDCDGCEEQLRLIRLTITHLDQYHVLQYHALGWQSCTAVYCTAVGQHYCSKAWRWCYRGLLSTKHGAWVEY